ncbi:low molecular weight phosphotyrosine protein phosphatase [Spongiibacter taiwanensis]|uniref:low molecular weight protein-tyrosine-phosphatase n=1 Tax=Spongiibacter taiwanensis TaxID=1748242 RepID=UPI0020356322|nr:low molecular weight protein-tyrosine-phosphatase [Spongiibacter taiwanensis]USA43510.1 low molecular weight phosphotyrosine protein phosphatase [Spongiibacter taiwanensis]
MSQAVLFVCLGNICRSPTAHGVFQNMVDRAGLTQQITIDSAGTGDWHIGHPPDRRMTAAAQARNIDLTPLRARQVSVDDFHDFDLILAMDRSNLSDLLTMKPGHCRATVKLFLDYADSPLQEVPDPYYGGPEGFETVLDLVEDGARGLLGELQRGALE